LLPVPRFTDGAAGRLASVKTPTSCCDARRPSVQVSVVLKEVEVAPFLVGRVVLDVKPMVSFGRGARFGCRECGTAECPIHGDRARSPAAPPPRAGPDRGQPGRARWLDLARRASCAEVMHRKGRAVAASGRRRHRGLQLRSSGSCLCFAEAVISAAYGGSEGSARGPRLVRSRIHSERRPGDGSARDPTTG